MTLLEALASNDEAAIDAAVRAKASLPLREQCPRPGLAAAWGRDEWRDWGTKFGFFEVEQTKHAFLFRHPSGTCFGVATSPGDVRSGMNLAQDVRMDIDERALGMVLTVKAIYAANPNLSESELVERTNQGAVLPPPTEGATDEQSGRIRSLIARLGAYTVSMRKVLRDQGMPEDDVERYLMLMKTDALSRVSANALIARLEARLEIEQAMEERAIAEKRRIRRERDEAQAAKAAEDPAKREFDAAVAASRSGLLTHAQGCMQKLTQLTNQLQALSGAVASSSLMPAYPAERIALLEKSIADAQDAADATTENLTAAAANEAALRARIDELEAELERSRIDREAAEHLATEAANSGAWKMALAHVVELVERHLSTNDFIQLASGVAAARTLMAETKKSLADNKPHTEDLLP